MCTSCIHYILYNKVSQLGNNVTITSYVYTVYIAMCNKVNKSPVLMKKWLQTRGKVKGLFCSLEVIPVEGPCPIQLTLRKEG